MRHTLILTCIALTAFAANSLLARMALAPGGMGGSIDAASYTGIRLASGALALAALLFWQNGRTSLRDAPGSWPSAAYLFAYAIAFSLAYLRLGAATDALILFGSVQGTMILWSVAQGDRPSKMEALGIVIAFGALVYLLLPGLGQPDLLGSLLMIGSGVAWGFYSLRGRTAGAPLAETAGNFIRAAALCLPLAPIAILNDGHAAPSGIALAVASGVFASGFGYAVWYRALPGLTGSQAGIVQLSVPAIAAFGAVVLLSEVLTMRLVIAAAFILGGVGLAISSRHPANANRG
jgi:drug/metabolite transporter (DMT)-like permease